MKKMAVFGAFESNDKLLEAQEDLIKQGVELEDFETLYPTQFFLEDQKDLTQNQGNLLRPFAFTGALVGVFAFLLILIIFYAQAETTLVESYSLSFNIFLIFSGLIGSGLIGALSGALVGIGTPQGSTFRYSHYLEKGWILMSVSYKTQGHRHLITETLKMAGAQDISVIDRENGWKSIRDHLADIDPESQNYKYKKLKVTNGVFDSIDLEEENSVSSRRVPLKKTGN